MTDDDGTSHDHRSMAVATFNATWDLMDKELRTAEENDMMVHSAHASRYHWGQVGGPTEFERGDWQVSRVYSLLGRGGDALHYARHCLDTCEEHDIGDLDLALAYEAMARAHALEEDWREVDRYTELAKEAAEDIEEPGNRTYFLGELDTVPRMP